MKALQGIERCLLASGQCPCGGSMEPSAEVVSAAPPLPVVLLYRRGRTVARSGHEADTLRELARQIAELKGTQFAGEFDEACAYPDHRYLIPDDTLTVTEARKLGVRSARD